MLPEIVLNYINKKKTEPRKEYTRVKDPDVPEILDMRRKGILIRVIAKRFGYSNHTISVICRRANIHPKKSVYSKRVWTNERKDMLAEMWNRGDDIEDIALRLGKSAAAVQSQLSVLKEEGYNIVIRKRGRPQKPQEPNQQNCQQCSRLLQTIMIQQSTFETIEVAGMNAALTALGLPHNREPRSQFDKRIFVNRDAKDNPCYSFETSGVIHPRDITLMQNLQQSGDQHAKVLRGIIAYVDINAPIYFWWDLETYTVGHQRLCSASTMHNECKGLVGEELQRVKGAIPFGKMIRKVDYFSYQTLRRIAYQRHNHRLPEFQQMIEWMHTLPFAEELIFHGLSKENGDPQLK